MQPIFIALSGTIAGLVLAPYWVLPSSAGWFCAIATGLMSYLFRRHHPVALFFLFLSLLIFSNLHYQFQLSPREEVIEIDNLAQKVTLTGLLTDVRQLTDGRSWLLLQVDSVVAKRGEITLEAPLVVRIYLGEGTDQLLPGDTIRCRSRLRQPRLFGTPGEFNWPRYLASCNTDMTGWVKNHEKITLLKSQQMLPQRALVGWRTAIATSIDGLMPEGRAYLVRALVLGEGRVIPDQVRSTLAKSGISHLFAISGLHLGMIGLLGYKLLLTIYRRFPRLLNWQPPQRLLPLLLLPLLLGYLLLTGDAVSTRRAFALAALGALFLCWRYYVNPLLLLASLALLSLQVNPLLLWQAGWHLSFVGAAGIILWRPLWQRTGNDLPVYLRYPLQLFLVTCAAMVATLPLVLFDFHLFAPAGIFANLICVPVITLLALPIGFSGLLCYQFVPQLAALLFQLCGLLLELMLAISSWFTAIPGLGGNYLFLSQWQYLAIGLLVLPVLLSVYISRQALLRCILAGFLTAALLWQFPLAQTEPLTLTMFSVGQGESMLLRNGRNQTILIDGGGFYSDRFDVGERLLAPAFGALGVSALDVVVLTHDDLDHRKGLIFILNHFPVGEFWIGNNFSDLHFSLQNALLENSVLVKTIPAGWSDVPFWAVGDLKIFNGATLSSNRNDASLVLHLNHHGDDNLLLTGDLEEHGVTGLLAAGLPGSVALLKIPHHGSRFSLTDHLVDQLQPQHCLVSSGYQNRYHLPSRQVVN
ncbi:MAG: DNA internalization-related competence protein ComEC/Rec2, partial [Desulfuromonadales bacterium]|nr:DNA internalization-related competence protein ComEC/Rec2 [Desulfuromonadales bacterium]